MGFYRSAAQMFSLNDEFHFRENSDFIMCGSFTASKGLFHSSLEMPLKTNTNPQLGKKSLYITLTSVKILNFIFFMFVQVSFCFYYLNMELELCKSEQRCKKPNIFTQELKR